METHRRDFSQTSIPGNFIFYGHSELTTEWDSFLAAEKAQTQVCSPPLLMHVLDWRWTFRVRRWLWFHLFLPLCSSAFLIYFTFILLHYMYPWSYPKSSFEAKCDRNKLKKKKRKTSWKRWYPFSSVQSLSRVQLCDPADCSTPGLPVRHQLPELALTHVHWVGDAIPPSHPLLSPFPPTFNLCQHQGLFKWLSSSNQVAKVLEFQFQHESLQWIFRTDFF